MRNLVLDVMFVIFVGYLNGNEEQSMSMNMEFREEVYIGNVILVIFRL